MSLPNEGNAQTSAFTFTVTVRDPGSRQPSLRDGGRDRDWRGFAYPGVDYVSIANGR